MIRQKLSELPSIGKKHQSCHDLVTCYNKHVFTEKRELGSEEGRNQFILNIEILLHQLYQPGICHK